ncbi:MAG: HD domain-containing phosphohydrolase [Pseudomonadota bacterium]
MANASPSSLPNARPQTPTLFQLPAAAAQARSKYLAQGFLLFVGLVFLVGTFLIIRWSSFALEQQARFWDSQLSQGAYNAAAHTHTQLTARQNAWRRLAQSDAIKLYTMQAINGDGDIAQASREYLDNALSLTLEREGFALTQAASSVRVNRPRSGGVRAGAALVSSSGALLMSFGGAGPIPVSARPATPSDDPARLYGPYLSDDDTSGWLSLVVDIEAVQSSRVIAQLHVTYPLEMIDMLPKSSAQVAVPGVDTALVQPQADLLLKVEGLTPVLRRAPAFNGDERYLWAAARGQGSARASAADGTDMLVAAQRVGETQWIAVQSIPKAEAMADVRRQTWIWLLGSIIALGLACALILLAWRRGVAQRATTIAAARDSAGQALADANAVLTSIADSQPSAVLLISADDTIAFANQAAAQLMGRRSHAELLGLTLGQSFPSGSGQPMLRAVQSARAVGRDITAATEIGVTGDLRHGRITAVPLDGYDDGASVMLAFDDVTELVTMRARREAALRHLVGVLTGLIDARDPYSASHSRSVARLSRHIARALNYGSDLQRDVEMAALLSNAGKILVPRDLLTKPEALSPDELARVRSAIQKTGDLLSSVEFDGHVRTILQTLEDHQTGDDTSRQAASIIVAANALVGMISPRAHREALALEDALAALQDVTADKHVLAAIDHAVHNQSALQKALSR